MERIPMVDLTALHAPLEVELREACARVLSSQRYILGAEVAAFEAAVARAHDVAHAVGVSSGSDALLALLMARGVGPGDEVVTTPYSFFATVEAIVRLGARPVFADVDPETFNLDPRAAGEKVGPATKAVLPVHLFGRPVPGRELSRACGGVELIEDAAQAVGAPGVGKMGRGAALSFFPAKNLGGFGDGGMVLTDDAEVADRVRTLRNHGASDKLRHGAIGGNFRLDELQAALLAVKLPRLDAWTHARRRVAARYLERLVGLPLGLPPADEACVWNQFVVRVPGGRRAALVEWLATRGISSAVYYPLPLHLQPAVAGLGYRPGDFPHAEQASREALALPIHPSLSDASADRVTAALLEFFS